MTGAAVASQTSQQRNDVLLEIGRLLDAFDRKTLAQGNGWLDLQRWFGRNFRLRRFGPNTCRVNRQEASKADRKEHGGRTLDGQRCHLHLPDVRGGK